MNGNYKVLWPSQPQPRLGEPLKEIHPSVGEIGNLNLYSQCVFLVNNLNGEDTGNLLDTNTIKSFTCNGNANGEIPDMIQSPVTKGNLSFPTSQETLLNNFTNISEKNTKEILEKRNSPSLLKRKSNCPDQKLFYVNKKKNSLSPILSGNIKSGVYKLAEQLKSRSKPTSRQNVYFSPLEKHGKILLREEFKQNYNRYGDYEKNLHANEPPSDSKRNSSGNTKLENSIECKMIIPEIVNLTTSRKPTICNTLTLTHPSSNGKINTRVVPRGRPRKSTSNNLQKPINKTISETTPVVTNLTTRYGRVCRPPKNIQKEFNCIYESANNKTQFNKQPQFDSSIFQKDFTDIEYKFNLNMPKNSVSATTTNNDSSIVQNNNERPKRERNLPAKYQCSYCHKIYLGRRMQRHLEANPDHNMNTSNTNTSLNDSSLYKILMRKIKHYPEEQQADVFLNEISDLIEQIQSRSSRLIRNTSGMHFVNSKTSKILGIPEGHYSIDVSFLDSDPDILTSRGDEETEQSLLLKRTHEPPRLDYNLSISLDDTISASKLNLEGENIIPSEDSLLRTVVEDLVVHGSIKNLSSDDHDDEVLSGVVVDNSSRLIHYDQASDNAVEAVVNMKNTLNSQAAPILDLSLDLFQFNNN